MVGNASGIDLNNASVHQLSRIGGIGPVLAARVVDRRPFRRWADLEEIEGFDHELVNDLRGSGAKLGRPGPQSRPKKPFVEVLRPPKPPQNDAARAGARGRSGRRRLSRNIFSGEGRDPE
jgi:hypothetical protein